MEKIHRLNHVISGRYTIVKFYSDHKDDAPLFRIAQEKFLVKNGHIEPLPNSFL